MADIRINSLPSTATSFNTDDYIAIDGASGGTRKMLASTLPLTDVTLGGATGPSVKSSLDARAARQGLVFDGTSYATLATAIPAFGTGDFSVFAWVNSDLTVSVQGLLGSVNSPTGGFGLWTSSDGTLSVQFIGNTTIVGPSGVVTAGKATLVGYTRTTVGGVSTGTFYSNGIAKGTVTDASNYSVGVSLIGAFGGSNIFKGTIAAYIENRALSASEVVSLFEAGVPSGADYNSASNTSIVTGFTNGGVSGSNTYGTYSGASATGFTAATTGATGRSISNTFGIVNGNRYRVSFTLTLNSGSVPTFVYLTNGVVDAAGSATPTPAVGANTIDFTATATTSSSVLEFVSIAAGNFVISGLTLTRLGLLLAPDAGQAGGGTTWYDTSGNAANITWTSGVSWNVPTSGKMAGNLTVNGGQIQMGGTNPYIQGTSGTGYIQFQNVGDVVLASNSGKLVFASNGATNATLATSGNLLIGTTTDGGQRLQVSGSSRMDGDVTMGRVGGSSWAFQSPSSDMRVVGSTVGAHFAIVPSSGNVLIGTTTDNTLGKLQVSGGIYSSNFVRALGFVDSTGTNGVLFTGATQQDFYTNGISALSIDSSQNATFAGSVTIAASKTLSLKNTTGSNSASIADIGGAGACSLQFQPKGVAQLTLDYDAATNTFNRGDVIISSGYTLQLGSGYTAGVVVTTGYVTIKASNGTTYKIPVGT